LLLETLQLSSKLKLEKGFLVTGGESSISAVGVLYRIDSLVGVRVLECTGDAGDTNMDDARAGESVGSAGEEAEAQLLWAKWAALVEGTVFLSFLSLTTGPSRGVTVKLLPVHAKLSGSRGVTVKLLLDPEV
jgi:hypothetical protein